MATGLCTSWHGPGSSGANSLCNRLVDSDQAADLQERARLVLFADISGSTRLFETFGDEKARDACAVCLEMLADVVEGHHGRVVKAIGDEIMAVFEDPSSGVMAGTDMKGVVRRASAERRFHTGEMRIKVGMHFGTALEEMDDLPGSPSRTSCSPAAPPWRRCRA